MIKSASPKKPVVLEPEKDEKVRIINHDNYILVQMIWFTKWI